MHPPSEIYFIYINKYAWKTSPALRKRPRRNARKGSPTQPVSNIFPYKTANTRKHHKHHGRPKRTPALRTDWGSLAVVSPWFVYIYIYIYIWAERWIKYIYVTNTKGVLYTLSTERFSYLSNCAKMRNFCGTTNQDESYEYFGQLSHPPKHLIVHRSIASRWQLWIYIVLRLNRHVLHGTFFIAKPHLHSEQEYGIE